MKMYTVTLSIRVPDIEAESEDDAINFVTEQIEDEFGTVEFSNQMAISYGE